MNKFVKFLITIFSLATLGVGGYFVYDKVIINYFKQPQESKNESKGLVSKNSKAVNPTKQINNDFQKELSKGDKTQLGQKPQSKANENKQKDLVSFTSISNQDLERAKSMKNDLPKNSLSFDIDFGNGFVGKENDQRFLGKANDGLYVYNLNENDIEKHVLADEKTKYKILNQEFNIFDKENRKLIYKLDYMGVYNQKISNIDPKNENIFKRNIRIANGTATILDANNEKTLLITNRHVLWTKIKTQNKKNKDVNFWNLPSDDIFKWYDNGQVHILKYNDLALLFYVKQTIEQNLEEQKTHNIKIEDKEEQARKQQVFFKEFLDPYFEVVTKFDNKQADVGLFYFKHKHFIEDIQKLADFFKKPSESTWAGIKFSNQDVIDKIKTNFLSKYQDFITFWESMVKAKPVVISDKLWKIGDHNYDKMISSFWPKATLIKNIFKGVYASTTEVSNKSVALFFYATNGPGASGSGVFNSKGELQFLNAFGLVNNKKKPIINQSNQSKSDDNQNNGEFYDNLNTYIAISGGVPFVTEQYNLKKEIEKFYPSNQKDFEQIHLIPKITTSKEIVLQNN